MSKIRVYRFVAVAFALAALAGCARSQAVNYYLLRSMQGPPPQAKALGQCMVVAVGPVEIPAYLDRPQMATRPSPDSLRYAEFDRWAEPLDKNLARVLADDLSARLGDAHVCVFPWPSSVPVRYQVRLTIVHLEKIAGEKVVLDASWSLWGKNGKKLLLMRRSRIVEPVDPAAGYKGIASAESRAVDALSREIAPRLAP
ncbi:MAG: PqiC family protein [Syntrophobacteraceae bacterium]